jgi:hypothetical protein
MDDWEIPVLVGIVCTFFLLIICAMAYGQIRSEANERDTAIACVQNAGEWIEGNCIRREATP